MRPKWSRSGEHLVLVRQVGAAAVDQIDAGQPVLLRDLLRAQMLLHRHREIGAALHRRVVGDDHALAPGHAADAGDDARPRAPRRHTCRAPRAGRLRGTASPDRAARGCGRAAAACRARDGARAPRRRRQGARDRPVARRSATRPRIAAALARASRDRKSIGDSSVGIQPPQPVLNPRRDARVFSRDGVRSGVFLS